MESTPGTRWPNFMQRGSLAGPASQHPSFRRGSDAVAVGSCLSGRCNSSADICGAAKLQKQQSSHEPQTILAPANTS